MLKPLCADEAIAKAVEVAGCSDFGPVGFREGLERSLAAFERLPLTTKAREFASNKVVQDLVTRLRIEEWYSTHPGIDAQPVEGPVFVVGLPRTGTTATVAMLALDERFRFLRGWEGINPIPPPIAAEEGNDPRLIAARTAAKNYDMAHMHLFDPEGPEEDLAFLSGLNMHAYYGAYPMPDDYLAWWLAEDFGSTYAYLERVFKLLHSKRPPHLWLLKSPPHLFRLDAIARQFPAAKFVMTHRDPLKVLASVASLHYTLYNERCTPGVIEKEKVGPGLLRFWTEGMRRALSARAALGEHRFIDVLNDDVIKRPLEVFERVYAHLGIDLTAGLKTRLVAYNSRNAPGAFGSHRYTLEEYGLSDGGVRQAFREYMDRFSL
jgi:Sulfotransferase family